jgi:hypothetical protein
MLSLLQDDGDDASNIEKEVRAMKLSSDPSKSPRISGTALLVVCCLLGLLLLLLLVSSRYQFLSKVFHRQSPGIGSKMTSSCDCINPAARCCDRTIFRTHKFGTILIGDMFLKFRQTDAKYRIHTLPTPKNLDYALPTTLDYRHVLVTRNWFDAIVSGYLYHKAGYECTMDYRGNATGRVQHHSQYFDLEVQYHLKDWDTDLRIVQRQIAPCNNRSFCQYLAEEEEETGIRMVMDFALSRWYKGVVPYYEKAQARMYQTSQQKSLFLCFEDLMDPFKQEDLFHGIASFLFPGLNETKEWELPGAMKASIEKQKETHAKYEGGHASSHDPILRERLRNLVEQYDREIFNHTVASSNAVFGCG